MMLLKIDINKWFSWLNLGIKDSSTASAVVSPGRGAPHGGGTSAAPDPGIPAGSHPDHRGNRASYENPMG